MNVYENAKSRINYIFNEFDNIYLSFSGGKDSGVMLNLCIDYIRENNLKNKITILYIDLEAMYKETVSYIERLLLSNQDIFDIEWVCLPMKHHNSLSMYEPYWISWGVNDKEKWVREMPNYDFVVNIDNHKYPFYKENMPFEQFIIEYAKYKSKDTKCACLVGIRTDESLNRWRAINRDDISRYNNLNYSVCVDKTNTINFYPIYDWKARDIWIYNGKYNKDYNKIYDQMYYAGVTINKMRICEPFGDEQKAGLNLFKVIEPETWNKLIDRVSGANFGNIYANTKATGYRQIELPNNHTWKSYCKFLLKTLPIQTRKIYIDRFVKFIKYWYRYGSPLIDEHIDRIKHLDIKILEPSSSNRGKGDKKIVRFKKIYDTIEIDNKRDFLTWRRMCIAIIKNDIACTSLGFGLLKHQIETRNNLIKKWNELL